MPQLRPTRLSFLYASKALLGSLLCWTLLREAGLENPFWAVITVILVSDPDLSIARGLAFARAVNTLLGCTVGLITMLAFGYAPLAAIAAAALTVLIATSIGNYPSNWRLAPVTVIILMDAGRLATSHVEEIQFALLRATEIGVGCIVALVLAVFYTRALRRTAPLPTAE